MNASRLPNAAGVMLYHSMLTHVSTCATSFHQLYSMMKLAVVGIAQMANARNNSRKITTRICEGRIRGIFACPPVARFRAKRTHLGRHGITLSAGDRERITGSAWGETCSCCARRSRLRVGDARVERLWRYRSAAFTGVPTDHP